MKNKCRIILIPLFVILFIISKAQEHPDSWYKRIDAFLSTANAQYKFNGVALVAQKGKVILHKGYGYKNVTSKIYNDTSGVFQICSMTKQFTATIILKLQEEGKLSTQDKLGKYFPEYKYGEKITLENLLTHTSGIYNYTNNIDENDSAIVCNPVNRQLLWDIIDKKPLEFTPGTKFSYDNSGYYLLGLIIEKVTSKPYEQVMRELVFEPLQMKHSGFDFIHLKDSNKTTGYKKLSIEQQIVAQRWDSTVTYSAGAIYSTSTDLYRWANAVANHEIISKNSWEQAFTPHLDKYGYGWWIDSIYGKKSVTHSGGMPGYMSNLTYFPDEDITIILLNNEGFYGESLASINAGISAIFFKNATPIFTKKVEIKLNDTILRKLVGKYAFNKEHTLIVSEKHAQLYIMASNPQDQLPKIPLYPESETHYFLKVADLEFEFVKDNDGVINKVITYLNGLPNGEWKKTK